MFSPRIIQDMIGGHDWGVACGHIKALGLFPFPHQILKACNKIVNDCEYQNLVLIKVAMYERIHHYDLLTG